MEININDQSTIYENYPLLQDYKILSTDFLKKYIAIAKLIKPTLTHKACDDICDEYVKFRLHCHSALSQPVTVRILETLIGVSTAHAKARMSKYIQQQDVKAAKDLIRLSYNIKYVVESPTSKREIIVQERPTASEALEPEKYIQILCKISYEFQKEGVTTLPRNNIIQFITEEHGDDGEITEPEVRTALIKMNFENIVNIENDIITVL